MLKRAPRIGARLSFGYRQITPKGIRTIAAFQGKKPHRPEKRRKKRRILSRKLRRSTPDLHRLIDAWPAQSKQGESASMDDAPGLGTERVEALEKEFLRKLGERMNGDVDTDAEPEFELDETVPTALAAMRHVANHLMPVNGETELVQAYRKMLADKPGKFADEFTALGKGVSSSAGGAGETCRGT